MATSSNLDALSSRKDDIDSETEDLEDTISHVSPNTSSHPTINHCKKAHNNSYEESLLEIPRKKKNEDEKIDEDKYFLLSLLPSFKSFNEEQKFKARTEIMNVMRQVSLSGTRQNQTGYNPNPIHSVGSNQDSFSSVQPSHPGVVQENKMSMEFEFVSVETEHRIKEEEADSSDNGLEDSQFTWNKRIKIEEEEPLPSADEINEIEDIDIKEEPLDCIYVKDEPLEYNDSCAKVICNNDKKYAAGVQEQKNEEFSEESPSSSLISKEMNLSNASFKVEKLAQNYSSKIQNEAKNNDGTKLSDTKLFKCSECDYKTTHKYYLNRHLLTHTDIKLFKCSECNYETNHKGNLNHHLSSHSDLKLFKCSECNYEANRKDFLKRHLLTHTDIKLFKCSECNYEANRRDFLRRHLLTHTDTKLFKCSECDYKTNREDCLKSHTSKHSDLKLFKCSECDFETNYKSSLNVHLLVHSDSKLLKCSECGYETNHKGSLNNHILIHTDSKLFKCSECDFKARRKNDLKRHALTHKDSKLFKCVECDYETNRRYYLQRHILKHANCE